LYSVKSQFKLLDNHYSMNICLIASILLQVLMYADTYWMPQHIAVEEVVSKRSEYAGKSHLRFKYFIATNKSEYKVTATVYSSLKEKDSVPIYKSAIANAPTGILLVDKGEVWVYNAGYLKLGGTFWLYGLFAAAMFLFFFGWLLKLEQGRYNLIMIMTGLTFLAFLYYINLLAI